MGLDGKELLRKNEHDVNYYGKTLVSYILGVMQRLYFFVLLCVKYQTSFISATLTL